MKTLAKNLRERAEVLGLANAEVARRAKLAERTYANYVLGRTEPNVEGLVRIAAVLQTTIDQLLADETGPEAPRQVQIARLQSAAQALEDDDLAIIVTQTEALLTLRKRAGRS